jgi:hypothetical protein
LSDEIVANAGTTMQLTCAAIALICLAGAATALATSVTWPVSWQRAARRTLVTLTWFGAVLLILRSLDIYLEFNLQLTGVSSIDPARHDNFLHLSRWFMFFWLPFFVLGAIAWTGLAWTYTRRGTAARSTGAPSTASSRSAVSDADAGIAV